MANKRVGTSRDRRRQRRFRNVDRSIFEQARRSIDELDAAVQPEQKRRAESHPPNEMT